MPRSIESKYRASLPFIRFMQTSLPLSLSSRMLKISLPLVRLKGAVTHNAVSANGVACEWVIPQNCQPERVLLYFHGGGFIYGLNPLHLQMGAYLAQEMRLRILMVDYRLAPAHPFPAAVDDGVNAYRWLLEQGFAAQNIVIAGDSAGGNLTLTTMMKLRDSGIPLPAAGACLSPVTDMAPKGGPDQKFDDPVLTPKAMRLYTDSYVAKNDLRNPLISPVFGDLHGLPPLLIHVGEDEILREDAIRITDRAKADGVEVRLEIYPRMWHVWQLFLDLPQAVESLHDISRFLQLHIEDVKPRINADSQR